jgi:sortase A
MPRGGLVAVLLLLALAVAGCGGRAEAAAPPVAEVVVAEPYLVTDPAPALAIGAPRLHNASALRVLPSQLEIPAIKVTTPVVELGWSAKQAADGAIFSEWDVADFAAGWHKNSAVPGEGGNVVMSGHNNIKGSVFRELDRLKPGDELYVLQGGKRYEYMVDEVLTEKFANEFQRKANATYIAPSDSDKLTLVSCWPRNDNTHRIVVIALPVEGDTEG